MGFWDKKIGVPQQHQQTHAQQPPVQPQQQQAPWWQLTTTPEVHQPQEQYQQPQQYQQQYQQPDSIEQAIAQGGEGLFTGGVHVVQLNQKHAKTGYCPECNSGNYNTQRSTTGITVGRCFDCGYPIQQRGSGMSGISNPSNGPSVPARQIPSAGFNDQAIINPATGLAPGQRA